MSQYFKQKIYYEKHARKEIQKLDSYTKQKIRTKIKELSEIGFLEYPDGKKIINTEFFEIKIKTNTWWRVIYTYQDFGIVILNIFNKKSKKTPKEQLKIARQRLNSIN